jgi:hypothetical protein
MRFHSSNGAGEGCAFGRERLESNKSFVLLLIGNRSAISRRSCLELCVGKAKAHGSGSIRPASSTPQPFTEQAVRCALDAIVVARQQPTVAQPRHPVWIEPTTNPPERQRWPSTATFPISVHG